MLPSRLVMISATALMTLLVIGLLVVGCSSGPPTEISASTLTALEGVAFQPGIGSREILTGNFDPDLTLNIEVFRLVSGHGVGAPVGLGFSTTDGSIKVEHEAGVEEHYIAVWNSRRARLPDNTSVRIEVRLPHAVSGAPACNRAGINLSSGCLAFLDVTLVKSMPRRPRGDVLYIVNGRSLPIKIHVERGAIGVDGFHVDPLVGDGSVSGWYEQIRFFASPGDEEHTGEAHFRFAGRTDPVGEVRVAIAGPDVGAISHRGLTIDGSGPLTEAEREVLEALASSPFADLLAMIPLDLACQEGVEALSPVVGAALLMPWQMILKYLIPERLEIVRAYADRSECLYFPDFTMGYPEDAKVPVASLLMLSHAGPIPVNLGYFPFDVDGAIETLEQLTQRLNSELANLITLSDQVLRNSFGPGNATCRGACGFDCPHTCSEITTFGECASRNGVHGVLTVNARTCGTHQGCRDHDEGYDICNRHFDEGTWPAYICRRDVDLKALAYARSLIGNGTLAEGMALVGAWASGYGLNDGNIVFEYTRATPYGPEKFTPCAYGCFEGKCNTTLPPSRLAVPPAPRCVSCGDVHLYTLDGLKYDYQGVGEFILVESDTADFAVQTRQQPWRSSKTVSVNSAVAMNVAGDRIGIYIGRTPNLYVNGQPTAASTHFTLPNGGHVYVFTGQYRILWPNGAVVNVRIYNGYLNVGMSLPTSMRGSVVGLVGNYDGDKSNDLVTRDGLTTLTVPPSPVLVHGEYGNSWRIAQGESLFDYELGADTTTYSDPSFPSRYVSVDTLEQSVYDSASQTCLAAGVTDPLVLDDCILDVAETGDTTFAQSSRDDTPSVSTFDTDAEGWGHMGDSSTRISHHGTGGNPGGHIRLHEPGQGTADRFVAPAKFLGNLSGYYGGTLSYDLRVNTLSSPVAPLDEVVLVGGDLTIYYSAPEPAAAGVWETFTVGLDAGAGWRANSATGAPATETQIRTVLAGLTALRIRADYRIGSELVDLDNVIINPEASQ